MWFWGSSNISLLGACVFEIQSLTVEYSVFRQDGWHEQPWTIKEMFIQNQIYLRMYEETAEKKCGEQD